MKFLHGRNHCQHFDAGRGIEGAISRIGQDGSSVCSSAKIPRDAICADIFYLVSAQDWIENLVFIWHWDILLCTTIFIKYLLAMRIIEVQSRF